MMGRPVLAALWITFATSFSFAGDLKVANVFGDYMVLQQEKPVRVWGWGEPGAAVAVGSAAPPIHQMYVEQMAPHYVAPSQHSPAATAAAASHELPYNVHELDHAAAAAIAAVWPGPVTNQ